LTEQRNRNHRHNIGNCTTEGIGDHRKLSWQLIEKYKKIKEKLQEMKKWHQD
jgi:hypothetical protein